MKKYIALTLALCMCLPFFSCGKQTVPDEYTAPRAPEPFCDELREIGVTVENPAIVAALGALDKLGSITLPDSLSSSGSLSSLGSMSDILGAEPVTYALTIDPAAESLSGFYKQGGEQTSSLQYFSMSPSGAEYKNTTGESTEGAKYTRAGMLGAYFGETLIGQALAYAGELEVGYKYDSAFLDKIAKITTVDWEENLLENTKTASFTLSGEQMADLIGALGGDEGVSEIMRGFYVDESSVDPIARLREDESFSFTERLTLHISSGRVLMADIRTRNTSSLLSLVFDGTTGDVTATAMHGEDKEAELTSRHEDGSITYTLSAKAYDFSRSARVILTDGAIYLESIDDTGKLAQSKVSFKYDRAEHAFTLSVGETKLTIKREDTTISGTLEIGDTKKTYALIFERTQSSEAGERFALKKIVTPAGEIDVSAAKISFGWSSVTA